MQTKEPIPDKGLARTPTPSPLTKPSFSPDLLLCISYLAIGLVNFAMVGDKKYFQLPQVIHDFVCGPWIVLVNILPFSLVVYRAFQQPKPPSISARKPASTLELSVWMSFLVSGLMVSAVWANGAVFKLPQALSSSLPGPLTALAILFFHIIPVCLVAHWEAHKDKNLLPRSEPLSLRERLVFLSFMVSCLIGLAVWAEGRSSWLPQAISEFLPDPLFILITLYLHMITIATFFAPRRLTESS